MYHSSKFIFEELIFRIINEGFSFMYMYFIYYM